VGLVLGGVPLAFASHQSGAAAAGPMVLVAAFGAAGVVVARRQPRNLVGWVLLVVAAAFVINP
jgi:hypothetical protein